MYHSQNAECRLALTFQMSQALAILQMNQLDLDQFIQEEIDKNPLLESVKKGLPPLDYEIPAQTTAYEYIMTQIRETFTDPQERQLAEKMTEYLDEKGFLTECPPDNEPLIATLQTLEPPGIFARNLQESLLIQLKAKKLENHPAYMLIQNDYEDLLNHRYSQLKKKYSLNEVLPLIASLQIRPLQSLKSEIYCPIIPEVFIRQIETGWAIGMCYENIPLLNLQYVSLTPESKEEQKTMDLWFSSAKWLIKTLSRRREILLKIATKLACHQESYLTQKGNLIPFTIQDLATELGLHESTISRAISGKYAETPQGIIPLRTLLTSSREKREAKEILQELIAQETTPLTDDQLSQALKDKGYPVARRTITKYRRELKIPPSQTRKVLLKTAKH